MKYPISKKINARINLGILSDKTNSNIPIIEANQTAVNKFIPLSIGSTNKQIGVNVPASIKNIAP
jgi:hypothetical protein